MGKSELKTPGNLTLQRPIHFCEFYLQELYQLFMGNIGEKSPCTFMLPKGVGEM